MAHSGKHDRAVAWPVTSPLWTRSRRTMVDDGYDRATGTTKINHRQQPLSVTRVLSHCLTGTLSDHHQTTPPTHAQQAMPKHPQIALPPTRGRCRKPRDKVEAEIADVLKPRWLNRVITATVTGDEPAELRLHWRTDTRARHALEDELFGKRILFTDKTRAPRARIVADYRSQHHVEADFRQLKDPHVVSFSPMWHWTDHKIRVHVFYCVLALAVARLMVREADRAGLHLSVRELLGSLAGIAETVLLYQGERGRPRARRMLTEQNPTQRRLYDLFGLDTYAPTR